MIDPALENLHAHFRAMAASVPGGELVETERGGRHHTSPSNPNFRGAWASGDAGEGVIDETVDWFAARGAPDFLWWTGTADRGLRSRLVRRGLVDLIPGGAPCMIADLRAIDPAILDAAPRGLSVAEVADEVDLLDFKATLISGFELSEPMAQAWVDASRAIGIGRTPWRLFLARLDGEPVATSTVFTAGGVAQALGITTAPSARGRGVGAAITVAPLLTERLRGVRQAVLFSTAMGVPVYQRIGFRLTGERIHRHLWQPGPRG